MVKESYNIGRYTVPGWAVVSLLIAVPTALGLAMRLKGPVENTPLGALGLTGDIGYFPLFLWIDGAVGLLGMAFVLLLVAGILNWMNE